MQISDTKVITKWKQDPYIIKMALDHESQTKETEQRNDIKSAIESTYKDYVIIENNMKPIGYIRIDWMDSNKEMAWLRFALGEDRGKGYANEALNIYLTKLFNKGCKRVEGEVYEYNIPSQKVLERLGFTKEGIKRKAHYTGEDYVDVFVYGFLSSDRKNR